MAATAWWITPKNLAHNRTIKFIEVPRPAFERAVKLLGGTKDGTLLALKGHLLLEEAIFETVCAKSANPQYVKSARLSFDQKLQMARALSPVPYNDEKRKFAERFWDASKALNKLRNELAHNLEPSAIGPLLKRLYVRELKDGESLSEPEIFDQLYETLCLLIGMAWGLAVSAKQTAEGGANR
jgi:hypothetical protein